MERVPTGIAGLDEMLNGGFIKNRHVVVCGGPGTGKTSMGYEFLYKGAKDQGDKGLFISLEQSPDRVVAGAKALFEKWDWDKMLKENKILITRLDRDDFANLPEVIESYVKTKEVRRVVIDSCTLLQLYFRNEDSYRNIMYELLEFFSSLDCNVLMTAERSHTKRGESSFGMEEFIADGVVMLYSIPKDNKRFTAVEILKMRDTSHSTNLVPFKITKDGIIVYPNESI